jgi:hypothetical protein
MILPGVPLLPENSHYKSASFWKTGAISGDFPDRSFSGSGKTAEFAKLPDYTVLNRSVTPPIGKFTPKAKIALTGVNTIEKPFRAYTPVGIYGGGVRSEVITRPHDGTGRKERGGTDLTHPKIFSRTNGVTKCASGHQPL